MNLTKPQQILYWMMYSGNKQLAFCPADRIILLKKNVFPNSKSISNALHQLKLSGYIVPYGNEWYITELGQEYLANVIEHANKKQACPKPKKDEWTDADFGITPEVRAYIDKLEAENAELKKKIEECIKCSMSLTGKRIDAEHAYEDLLKKYNALLEENEHMKKQLEALNASECNIHSYDDMVNESVKLVAKIINKYF